MLWSDGGCSNNYLGERTPFAKGLAMGSNPFDLFPQIAQITAAFAGFGSLATGLGHRRGADDARMDAYRLQNMLRASLSATLFGLLPATFIGLTNETWGLRISACVGVAGHLIFTPIAVLHARKLRHVAGFSIGASLANFGCALVSLIAFGLCALNFPRDHAPNLYLLGLVALLASSGLLFSRVIISMLRPLHNSKSKS